MSKLSQKEREGFTKIIREDLCAINKRFGEQIQAIWAETRQAVLDKLGHERLIDRKKEIVTKIRELNEEAHQIEIKLSGKPLTVQQSLELGGKLDDYGRAYGANFYGIPIRSKTEFDIVQKIKEKIDLGAPAKFLFDLARSSLREIVMSGSFEEARKVYDRFYDLDFRRFGVDIPPRLADMKAENPLLTPPKPKEG